MHKIHTIWTNGIAEPVDEYYKKRGRFMNDREKEVAEMLLRAIEEATDEGRTAAIAHYKSFKRAVGKERADIGPVKATPEINEKEIEDGP